ncbi:GNAT family N-acetyltransferase [Atopomonas sediminilitoris]|uniref:GNAT family N-acetyltransferase n=1 Tax=Atopomonas sediminilitoris TaxID=2919919 RepID=UPI001F4E128F|nr:GNAT family N-acetyltransferase [Atopomonas sediminilitoris]MCJ8170880.1 GNAT family N-acetyltransferase [Atopomonas sediminilitoris]
MPEGKLEIRQLNGSYRREARSLLYQAYRHEPTFAHIFEQDRPGFDQRVRASVRELVEQHFNERLPSIGLVLDDRLIGIALVSPPSKRFDITESWMWRMRMVLTAGFRCTRRYLDYHQAVLDSLPAGQFTVLPLIGIHPSFQGHGYGLQLLEALHDWCADDQNSKGVVLDTGNARYLEFYQRLGYQEVGQVALGPVLEHVLYHPNPQRVSAAS